MQILRNPIHFKVDDKVELIQHVSTENSPLEYTQAQVYNLSAGGEVKANLSGWEACVVALAGKITVSDGETTYENIGTRDSVFEKIPTDSVYIPNGKEINVVAQSDARIIICYAPSKSDQLNTTLIKAEDNSIERRGEFNNRRLVHNILDDQSEIAESLLVVEVYTDTANWSSYPPHKHDQDNLPEESFLEEIYYHEVNPDQGFIFQRIYTDDRLLDETMSVYNQGTVLVPAGYHPVGVPDGYESYYLNIMAGPTKKWVFNNEKDHEWILER